MSEVGELWLERENRSLLREGISSKFLNVLVHIVVATTEYLETVNHLKDSGITMQNTTMNSILISDCCLQHKAPLLPTELWRKYCC